MKANTYSNQNPNIPNKVSVKALPCKLINYYDSILSSQLVNGFQISAVNGLFYNTLKPSVFPTILSEYEVKQNLFIEYFNT